MNIIKIAEMAIGVAVGVSFTIFVIWVISKIEDAAHKRIDKKYK